MLATSMDVLPPVLRESHGHKFCCQHCGKGFHYKHHLNGHVFSAHGITGGSRLTCPICGRSFGRTDVLHRHMKTIHKTFVSDTTTKTATPNSNSSSDLIPSSTYSFASSSSNVVSDSRSRNSGYGDLLKAFVPVDDSDKSQPFDVSSWANQISVTPQQTEKDMKEENVLDDANVGEDNQEQLGTS